MQLAGFRDPYVIRKGGKGQDWHLLIGSGLKGQGGTLLLYKSKELQSGDPSQAKGAAHLLLPVTGLVLYKLPSRASWLCSNATHPGPIPDKAWCKGKSGLPRIACHAIQQMLRLSEQWFCPRCVPSYVTLLSDAIAWASAACRVAACWQLRAGGDQALR